MEESQLLKDSKILENFSRVCLQKLDPAKVNELAEASQSRHLLSLKLVQRPEQADKRCGFFSIDDCFDDAEIVSNLQQGKYQNFILKEWEIDVDHSMKADPTLNKRFWTSVASYMTTLTLSHCKIYQNLSLLPGNFWHKVPFLKDLTLLNCQFVLSEHGGIEFKRNLTDWMSVQQKRIEHLKGKEEKLQQKLATPHENPNIVYFTNKKLKHVRSYLKGVEDRLEDLRDQGRGYPGYRNEPHLNGLRSLCVQNTDIFGIPLDIDYGTVVNLFPNLEKIALRLEIIYECTSSKVSGLRELKELDVMRTETFFTEMPPVSILTVPAESLTFDCGLKATAEKVDSVLKSQAHIVRKLSLFRAPYAEPFSSISCNNEMTRLTRLELWGTVTSNLNFLKFMPNLQQFKWCTNCYDEETHGARLHRKLGQDGIRIMYADEIVRNTDGFRNNFTLATFELECGALSVASLKRLGRSFRNLWRLKVAVTGTDELIQIGRQWPALEHLELAHGSYVAPATMLNIFETCEIFPSLKSFTWKGCACYKQRLDITRCVVDQLEKNANRKNLVLTLDGHHSEPQGSTCSATKCVRDLYEKALIYGEKAAMEFRKVLHPLTVETVW